MELNEIKILVTKYFDGETTLLEERALYDYLHSRQDLDDEMMAAKMMLSAFAQNRQIKASYEVPVPKVGRKRVYLRRWVAFAAASSVLAFVVMMAYTLLDAKSDVDSAPEFVCYVDGKRVIGEQMAMAESERIVGDVFGSVNEALKCVYRVMGCASE